LKYRRWAKSKKPLLQVMTHHRQNPLNFILWKFTLTAFIFVSNTGGPRILHPCFIAWTQSDLFKAPAASSADGSVTEAGCRLRCGSHYIKGGASPPPPPPVFPLVVSHLRIHT
jgi:hypothetical protein